MPFPQFDRNRLEILPLSQREHDMTLNQVLSLDAPTPPLNNPNLSLVAQRIAQARKKGSAVIMMMGAHVIKVGLSRYVIDLMQRGLLTHIAMNGAGPIHDYELALVGATTESVSRYIRTGHFGLWKETGRINDIVKEGVSQGLGYGESIGKHIADNALPHADVSILAAGYRLKVPVTVHIGIGYDIIYEHPNCDGAALGQASYTDFLIFAHSVSQLEGGVLLNFGTSVMGPEVYLKALSMARNAARQEGKKISRFTTAVFDLVALGEEINEEPPKSDARYYYRPLKTILIRTVRDGGESFYIQGDHVATLPSLFREVIALHQADLRK